MKLYEILYNSDALNQIYGTLSQSFIVGDNDEHVKQCVKVLEDELQYIRFFNLLYRASRDGFGADDFHQRCDYKGPTLIVIKDNQNEIFGGFTSKSWIFSISGHMNADNRAFLFSITRKKKYMIMNYNHAVLSKNDRLCDFGELNLVVYNNAAAKDDCESRAGQPAYFIEAGENGQSSLFGKTRTTLVEIEVY